MADQPEQMDIEIDPKEFRTVLGHFPTGVTVVAGIDDTGAHGLAIGSFFSISLDPPLVGFCVGESSQSWAKVAATGKVRGERALRAPGRDLQRVRGQGRGQVRRDPPGARPRSPGRRGSDEAVAHIDCDLETDYPGGDHQIVVGRVRSLQVHREEHGPLLFFKGAYGRHVGL